MSKAMHFVQVLAASLTLALTAAAQQPVPEWNKAFDQRDLESRRMLASIRCLVNLGGAVRAGLFGPGAATANNSVCVERAAGPLAVMMTVDSLFVSPTQFAAVDLVAKAPMRAPVDTAGILALARAEWIAGERSSPWPDSLKVQQAEISYRVAGDSIQVWLIPGTAFQGPPFSVGGEHGFLFSPDGKRVVREVDATADYRMLTLADTGALVIKSRGDSLPTLSEMFFANLANQLGRTSVTLQLPRLDATLVGSGATAVWVHVRRKP